MRNRLYGGLAVLVAAFGLAAPAHAQGEALTDASGVPGGSEWESFPLQTRTPLGNPGRQGFYATADLLFFAKTNTLGKQIIAYRGLVDSTGALTTVPGTYIGSGAVGLSTDMFGRRSYTPGWKMAIGFKTDDDISIQLSYLAVHKQDYNASTTLVPNGFIGRRDLVDTYLTSPVYNFPQAYAGPTQKTTLDGLRVPPNPFVLPNGLFYGIWNGASVETIRYTEDYTQWDIGGRVPLFDTSYSKIYGLAGVRMDWFMERFRWRAQSFDINGNSGPNDAANYTNNLSQRMYGPYIGCGHELYAGNRFSMSADMNAGLLIDVIKERATYRLEDQSIENKRSVNDIGLVPTVGGNANLWWYPIEGLQIRVGYNAQTFFGTKNMTEPVSFNYGGIAPVYGYQGFRIVHGVNVGVGFFF